MRQKKFSTVHNQPVISALGIGFRLGRYRQVEVLRATWSDESFEQPLPNAKVTRIPLYNSAMLKAAGSQVTLNLKQ